MFHIQWEFTPVLSPPTPGGLAGPRPGGWPAYADGRRECRFFCVPVTNHCTRPRPAARGRQATQAPHSPRRAKVSRRTHRRAAHNGARLPAAKCVSAPARTTTPRHPRGDPRPAAPRWRPSFLSSSRRQAKPGEEGLHPCSPAVQPGREASVGARRPQSHNPCVGGDAGRKTVIPSQENVQAWGEPEAGGKEAAE